MTVRTAGELDVLREGGHRLAEVLAEIVNAIKPGVSTLELDRLAESLILASGGEPAFKGYRTRKQDPPFPASLCTSVNDEVVHAIPRAETILRQGDIIGLDIGMLWPASPTPPKQPLRLRRPGAKATAGKPSRGRALRSLGEGGLITDMAVTVPVGRISPEAGRLLGATRRALEVGIAILKPGIQLGDLGHAIQSTIEAAGFGVVRELVGHGVGRRLHEPPHVPNYGTPGTGPVVGEGMILAIEPMATAGDYPVKLDSDGWTFKTRDGSLAAHFEHTVVITKNGAEILTR